MTPRASAASNTHAAPGSSRLREALALACERLLGWADLLDQINVFPVPDGDTGRNLTLSLSPLRDTTCSDAEMARRLLMAARGNSGNIAVEFVRTLLDSSGPSPLEVRLSNGALAARRAVAQPQEGTMLTTLDVLARCTAGGIDPENVDRILDELTASVRATGTELDAVRRAGVVDSGALGMLILLEGFLSAYFERPEREVIGDAFRDLVHFQRRQVANHAIAAEEASCIDAVLRLPKGACLPEEALRAIGHEVVSLRDGDLVKVHLHARDEHDARAALARMGEIVRFSRDDLREQTERASFVTPDGAVHVMTDAAASITRFDAEALGITLLDSYVNFDRSSLPETRLSQDEVYAAMSKGARVTTSQASTTERTRHYERTARHHPKTLYLSVGSVYTGNYALAASWVKERAIEDRMVVLDSGAASGRLAVAVWAVARRAGTEQNLAALAAFAQRALARAEEYIFLDRLTYLARGGRVGKTSAVLADFVGIAPVITPMPDGVHKLGVFRGIQQKVAHACKRLETALASAQGRGLVLLQHTDNRAWVEEQLAPRIREQFPHIECHIRPISLTSGVHMGPGTWAIAVLPSEVA